MLKRATTLLIPIAALILTFTLLIAGTRALAQTQPRVSWLTWVQDGEIYYWDGAAIHRLTDLRDGAATSPVWSNDGWMAWINDTAGSVVVWDGQTVRSVSQSGTEKRVPRWSSTGQLAWVDFEPQGARLIVWDRSTGIILNEPAASYGLYSSLYAPLWSPDGRLAWVKRSYPDASSDLMVWDGDSIINVSNTPNHDECLPAWSNDRQLAWIIGCASGNSTRKSLMVWDGETVTTLDYFLLGNFSPFWSSNNRLAWGSNTRYLGTGVHDVYVWDGSESVLATGDLGVVQIGWSPNGTRLAFASEIATEQLILSIWNGETITQIITHNGYPFDFRWVDDTRIIYGTRMGDYFLWNGDTVTQLTHTPESEQGLIISTDGRAAWIDDVYSNIYVWDGQSIMNITNSQTPFPMNIIISDLSWSPIIP